MITELATGDLVTIVVFGSAQKARVTWVSNAAFGVGDGPEFIMFTFALEAEGSSWIRGWEGDAAEAFCAAVALTC